MSTINEVLAALKALTLSGINKIIFMFFIVIVNNPTPYKDVNLNVLITLKNLGYKIGYSRLSYNWRPCCYSFNCNGAEVIEKHVTLNKIQKDQITHQVWN